MVEKKTTKVSIVFLLLLIVVVIASSYAIITINIPGEKEQILVVGNLNVTLQEDSLSDIHLVNAAPTSDIDGPKQLQAYKFTVNNGGTQNVTYDLYLDDDEEAKASCKVTTTEEDIQETPCGFLSDSVLKYELKYDEKSDIRMLNEDKRKIYSGSLTAGDHDDFELRMWLDYNAENDSMGKYFFGKLRLEVKQSAQK